MATSGFEPERCYPFTALYKQAALPLSHAAIDVKVSLT